MSSWLLGVPIVLILLFGCLVLPHNLRMWRCRRDRAELPPEVVNKALLLIEEHAGPEPALTLMIPSDEGPEGVLFRSHLGGTPYAEAGETWPRQDNREDGTEDPESPPAAFLGQFVLTHAGLPEVWENRLLTVFLEYEPEQVVRSHAEPATARYVPLAGGPPEGECVPLRPLPIPATATGRHDDGEAPEPFEPVALLNTIRPLGELLSPHTKDPEGVLAQLLAAGRAGYSLEAPEVVYQGGRPSLIQNEHDARCPECSEPMRFLLQLGDVVPGVILGDAGVLYVYGCDRHPERCAGYVDSH